MQRLQSKKADPRCPHESLLSSICASDSDRAGVALGIQRRGRRVFDSLSSHGIVCDWREPDLIRIAPAPLYNRFVDVFDFVEGLAAALKEIS